MYVHRTRTYLLGCRKLYMRMQHPNFECVGSNLSVHFQASVSNFQDGSGLLAELRVFDDSLNKAFEPMQCLGNETAHHKVCRVSTASNAFCSEQRKHDALLARRITSMKLRARGTWTGCKMICAWQRRVGIDGEGGVII